MYFIVSSQSNQGVKNSDLLYAQSYDDLLQELERENTTPLRIVQIPTFLSPILSLKVGRISQDEVIEMIEDLHLIFKSGLPLHQGIVDLANDSDNKEFKNMLFHIASDIQMGKSLSNALEVYKDVVGDIVLNLIKIGEESGQLEVTLKRGATFLRRVMTLKKKVKTALIYPLFAFSAVMGAMLVWMIYVLPQMTELFKEMNIELPTLTVVMINISQFISSYIAYMLLTLVLLVIAFKLAHRRYQSVRWFTDKYMLKIPVIKQIISSFNMAFISEYLRLALISGIPLSGAMDTLKKNVGNELYKNALQDVAEDVTKGSPLSFAFVNTKLFAPFMTRMMSVGESSGTLEPQLELISEHYYEKVDYYAENIGKIIEPIVLIIVGGFMALIMLGLMGPIYDLASNIK
ncbi:MAG: type II secretion system F family protein [Campylobacterales bacterium]|nr:type II secretion system F family protein [Campylobacterales bacterium]